MIPDTPAPPDLNDRPMAGRAGTALAALALLAALLAGCADGARNWDKPGVASDRKSADLTECRAQARAATQRDTAIDTDIMNSRSTDWQKSGSLTVTRDAMKSSNVARFGDIVGRCMAAKGYSPAD